MALGSSSCRACIDDAPWSRPFGRRACSLRESRRSPRERRAVISRVGRARACRASIDVCCGVVRPAACPRGLWAHARCPIAPCGSDALPATWSGEAATTLRLGVRWPSRRVVGTPRWRFALASICLTICFQVTIGEDINRGGAASRAGWWDHNRYFSCASSWSRAHRSPLTAVLAARMWARTSSRSTGGHLGFRDCAEEARWAAHRCYQTSYGIAECTLGCQPCQPASPGPRLAGAAVNRRAPICSLRAPEAREGRNRAGDRGEDKRLACPPRRRPVRPRCWEGSGLVSRVSRVCVPACSSS